MKNFLVYLSARLRERSTWLGIISIATALGLVLGPAAQEAIIAAGMAAGGLIAALLGDGK